MVRAEAEQVNVPIALHLDHGTNVSPVERAIGQCGRYTSVMADASHNPFAENMGITRRVVDKRTAKRMGGRRSWTHPGYRGQRGQKPSAKRFSPIRRSSASSLQNRL